MVTPPLYRTDFAKNFRTHVIDGVTLTFHRPSGATHFLISPAPEIMALLSEAPMDSATLTRRLCATLDLPEDAEARAVVEARLAELVSAGLVLAV